MYNTANKHLEIDSGNCLPLSMYAPYDPGVDLYVYSKTNLGFETATPLEYSNWRDEVMSWKQTCYIHVGLNPRTVYRVKGPDAIKLFSDICVNGFSKFPVGTLKHGIICNEKGIVISHGVLLRTGEDDFISHSLAPYVAYKLETGNYNAKGEYISDWFVFQLGGPRSLEILETATGECLHDIKFGHHRTSCINGMNIRITRMGMAGTLSYEVHGKTKDVISVYNAIMNAGEPFGIRKLGLRAYKLNHTEAGFPQSFVHFPCPLSEDRGLMDFLGKTQKVRGPSSVLLGSMGTDIRLRYRNPVELGWEKTIKFDHDFIGRDALEKEMANPRRKMVTLVWNVEDIADVYISQFRSGEPYMAMETDDYMAQKNGGHVLYADQVLKGGKLMGVSSGRAYSYYYRRMLSLCSIDTEYASLGTEVTVLWGNPGTRQKQIRGTVSRFPYLNENRNEDVDVSTIPCVWR